MNATGIFLLWGALAVVGFLGARRRRPLPVWALAAAVFTAALCLVLGLVLILP